MKIDFFCIFIFNVYFFRGYLVIIWNFYELKLKLKISMWKMKFINFIVFSTPIYYEPLNLCPKAAPDWKKLSQMKTLPEILMSLPFSSNTSPILFQCRTK